MNMQKDITKLVNVPKKVPHLKTAKWSRKIGVNIDEESWLLWNELKLMGFDGPEFVREPFIQLIKLAHKQATAEMRARFGGNT